MRKDTEREGDKENEKGREKMSERGKRGRER